jgi:hypothetical protein
VQPLHLRTYYLPWHGLSFSAALQLHSAAILPIQRNPFTACKTANRVLTAALHGLNVVADEIASYAPFADCTVLDDWQRGLGSYLHDEPLRARHRATMLARTQERYSLDGIAEQWRQALALGVDREAAQR